MTLINGRTMLTWPKRKFSKNEGKMDLETLKQDLQAAKFLVI